MALLQTGILAHGWLTPAPVGRPGAHGGPPAGGAALGEVLSATALGLGMTAALLLLVVLHRTGRTTVLATAAERVGRRWGSPGWVALPVVVARTSLLLALLGMYWDIALHISRGRDEGPLANPAHYPILFGLFGLFAAGVLAMALPRGEQPGPAAVRLSARWSVPTGGLLLAGAGGYALLGFPLDDVWHRLFGQDVTLWGPTHLMLIGGAGLSLVGIVLLEREGQLARAAAGTPPRTTRGAYVRRSLAFGGLLVGLSVFQAEFDFGVPQFRLVLQPLLLAGAAGVALVAARLLLGRGGALAAVAAYWVVRGLVSLAVGVGFDQPTPSLPLYLGCAVAVEAAALVLARRPLVLGVVGGLAVGTVGVLTEAAWSQAVMRLPWTSDVLAEGLLLGAVAGTAGGTVGALFALGLRGELPRPRVARTAYALSLLAVSGALANGLVATVPAADATVALERVGDGSRAMATVTLDPAGAADRPAWLTLTSWQGGGLVVEHLERQADGSWTTDEPVPVSGDWKTMVRLQDGRTLTAAPVWLPADPAIGAPEVLAERTATRPFVAETEVLQRERSQDIPAWLWLVGCLVVLVCSLVLVAALGWGVGRVGRRVPAGSAYGGGPAVSAGGPAGGVGSVAGTPAHSGA